jgi:hypothetical protein
MSAPATQLRFDTQREADRKLSTLALAHLRRFNEAEAEAGWAIREGDVKRYDVLKREADDAWAAFKEACR